MHSGSWLLTTLICYCTLQPPCTIQDRPASLNEEISFATIDMDICGPPNSHTFGLCPHSLYFLPEYLPIVCRPLKSRTTIIHFINDKNGRGDNNITTNEDSDSLNGGNAGDCSEEGNDVGDNTGDGNRDDDGDGTCGNGNGVDALSNGDRGGDGNDDYVTHRNGGKEEDEGIMVEVVIVVTMMEMEILM